eukprot:9189-Prorocentrum_minimum.AAC.1
MGRWCCGSDVNHSNIFSNLRIPMRDRNRGSSFIWRRSVPEFAIKWWSHERKTQGQPTLATSIIEGRFKGSFHAGWLPPLLVHGPPPRPAWRPRPPAWRWLISPPGAPPPPPPPPPSPPLPPR